MKPLPIIQSPGAPGRLEDLRRPATVLDVLTGACGRNLSRDLEAFIRACPGAFQASPESWELTEVRVTGLRVRRVESFFRQDPADFRVDLLCMAEYLLQERRRGPAGPARRTRQARELRLRYRFRFLYCRPGCAFEGAFTDERDSLAAAAGEGDIPLDRYLLPVLRLQDYEALALQLRARYCPGLRSPEAELDPADWALATGTPVVFGHFDDPEVLGEFFFDFGTADLADPETGGVLRGAAVWPGTVVLNAALRHRPAEYRGTLCHELVHGLLCRFFFALQRAAAGGQVRSCLCRRRGSGGESGPCAAMEIQANTLPRFLLIPPAPGRRLAEEFLAGRGGRRDLETMNALVTELADYFCVTRTMARSRLTDFGYPEAEGIMRTLDGRLLPDYVTRRPRGLTHTVTGEEALQEFLRNPVFRRALESGEYVRVPESCCYCRDDPRFLTRDSRGVPHLTRAARENMDCCCLVFRAEPGRPREDHGPALSGVLRKSAGTGRGNRVVRYQGPDGGPAWTEEGLRRREALRARFEEEARYRVDFNTMLKGMMEARGFNKRTLAEAAGLSEDVIQQMRNRRDVQHSVRQICAVCIAMHLEPRLSAALIEASPAKFLDTEEMNCYRYALVELYREPLARVNRWLVEMGIPPLTNLVEGFDENGAAMG